MGWYIETMGKFYVWGTRSPVGRIVRGAFLFFLVAIGLATGILLIAAIGAFAPVSTATTPFAFADRRTRWQTIALALMGTCSFVALMVTIRESYYSLDDPSGGPLSGATLKILAWTVASIWLLISAWMAVRVERWRPQPVRRGYPTIAVPPKDS